MERGMVFDKGKFGRGGKKFLVAHQVRIWRVKPASSAKINPLRVWTIEIRAVRFHGGHPLILASINPENS
jgi:hypothetical protein